MKAILFETVGGPEVLRLGDAPIPALKPRKVLIKNRAIGVNFADTRFRQGRYVMQPRFPDTPGLEAAGVVEAVGEGVDTVAPGARVAAIGVRTYAEYALVSADQVMPLPDSVGFEQGAAFPIQTLTAYHLLHTCHQTAAGQTVLVHSAAGGVGIVAMQIAKAAGARVIGTVSSDAKAELARQYGADAVINYERQDFAEAARELTDGRGVELILDAVGKPTFAKGLSCLAPFGQAILYGQAGGAPEPLNVFGLFQHSLKVSCFGLYTASAIPELHQHAIANSFQLMEDGKLTLLIGKTYPLDEAAEAHRFMESRQSVGKLILTP